MGDIRKTMGPFLVSDLTAMGAGDIKSMAAGVEDGLESDSSFDIGTIATADDGHCAQISKGLERRSHLIGEFGQLGSVDNMSQCPIVVKEDDQALILRTVKDLLRVVQRGRKLLCARSQRRSPISTSRVCSARTALRHWLHALSAAVLNALGHVAGRPLGQLGEDLGDGAVGGKDPTVGVLTRSFF